MLQRLFFIAVFLGSFVLHVGRVSAAQEVYLDIPIDEDTYVEEKFPDVSPWNNRNLYLGTDTWFAKGKTRILIMPEYATIKAKQLLASDITTAEVHITSYEYEGTKGSVTIDTYTPQAPWDMYSVTWQNQPSISSKKDSSIVSTNPGTKFITVTKTLQDSYQTFLQSGSKRGMLFKINAETEKALILWAHGCNVAPSPPQCANSERPFIRIFYKNNEPPSACTLAQPLADSYSNTGNIVLQAKVSSDPDNEILSYSAKVCTDVTCKSIQWEGSISATSKTTISVPDGSYFLTCTTTDQHAHAVTGETIQTTVDTVPPATPTLTTEPEFTATQTNMLYWFPHTEQGIEYQLLSSERSSFTSFNTYSSWTPATSIAVTHLKEKKYYYKLHARDKAGNVSDWSIATETTIDTLFPQVNYFKSNKTILSPKKLKDGTLDNTAYIQGSITDANIDKLTITVTDKNGTNLFTATETEKSYLWLHWPDTLSYPDGTYSVQLAGIDSLDRVILSEPIFVTIDTKPPKPAKITGIENNKQYAKNSFSVSIVCENNTIGTVYVSGRITSEGKRAYTVNLKQTDGSHTLSVKCTDIAGNFSTSVVRYLTDTTPPSAPSLNLAYDKDKKLLTGKIYCREDAKVAFSEYGTQTALVTCKKNGYAIATLAKTPAIPSLKTYTARIADKLGNWSTPTEASFYIAPTATDLAKAATVSCVGVYHQTYNTFTTAKCYWPKTLPVKYVQTVVSTKKGEFTSDFVFKQLTTAKVSISFIGCKNKTFWDPRTWFWCVEENLGNTQTYARLTPKTNTQNSSWSESKGIQTLRLEHRESKTLDTAIFLEAYATSNISANAKPFMTTSPVYSQTTAIALPVLQSRKYFSWLFSFPAQVSQWHGMTAYERPHGGLDFSVHKAAIYMPADGKVVSVATHKSSACFGGGNYVAIQHPNGLYTYYFHLASLADPKGKKITKGTKIKQGMKLLTSGNSGMYNCEPLGYHLHFEVRTSQSPRDHINPVPYISTDWNTVKTASAKIYPGRLTGDNPHPKY